MMMLLKCTTHCVYMTIMRAVMMTMTTLMRRMMLMMIPEQDPQLVLGNKKSFHLSFAKLVSNINFKFNQENSFPYRVQKNL